MPNLNISNLTQGDSQEDIIRKINNNFDSIVANGGGPQGKIGKTGPQGAVGPAGPKGDPGQEGRRGTQWFVQSTEPIGGSSDPIFVGDYWVNPSQGNKIFQYEDSGWVDTGANLKASEAFKLIEEISGPTGNKDAIVFGSPFPEKTTMVLSDSISTTTTANPNYSKLLLSTNGSNDYPILEFSKTDAPGIGTPTDYTRHPQFRWLSPVGSNYDLLFTVPQDGLTLSSGSGLELISTNGNVDISSSGSVDFNSAGVTKFTAGSDISFSLANNFFVTSSNFNMGSSSMNTSVPISITSNTTDYVFSSINENTSNSAGGVVIDTSTASNSSYLLDLTIGSTRYFGVRADGRIEGSRMVQGRCQFVGNSTNTAGSYAATGTGNIWFIGYLEAFNGNFIEVDLNPTSGTKRYISIPQGNIITQSWGQYLKNNTAINLRIVASDTSKAIDGLYLSSNYGPGSLAPDKIFATAVLCLDLIIARGSSSTVTVYYNSDKGYAGILT